MGQHTLIDASVKSWLDNVIIPGLVLQFKEARKVCLASTLPSDNNPEVTDANQPTEVQP
jgi:hypothetical protein